MNKTDYSFERKLARALEIIFVIISVALIIYQFLQGNYMHVLRCMLFPLFLLIPPLFRWLKLTPPWRLICFAYAFSIFAFSYGCVWGAFKDAAISDKISHFISGFLFTILGFCLYYMLSGPRRGGLDAQPGLAASYALFFSMFIAVIWECIEFFDFTVLGNDSQHHLTTGVFDTMYDLICCLVASVISAVAFILWRRKGVKLLTAWIVEEFYDVNVAGRPEKQPKGMPKDTRKKEKKNG